MRESSEDDILKRTTLVGEHCSEGFSNAKHAEMVNGRVLAFGKTN